jgi:peptidoglycan hydrolase-like protein with peptidoglycan-binding domain
MNPIIFPLEPQMQGPTVADLQAALELLELTIADAEKTAQRYGTSTRQAVRQFQTAHDLPVTGQVNQATASVLNNILAELDVLDNVPGIDPTPAAAYTVIGRVLRANGPAITGAQVQAFHQNLRTEILLGSQRTDEKGFYTIRYNPPQGISAIDLVVRVNSLETDQEIARSALICPASRMQVVDVIVGGETYRGFSEFERLTRAIQPHLDGALLVTLTVRDIELLACKSAQDALRIAYLVVASRYQQRTDVAAAVFYGFLRRGLPTSLFALLSQQTKVQRTALKAAITANIIHAALDPETNNDILRQLKRAAVNLALEAPEGQENTSLTNLLSTTGLSATDQNALLTRYALHEGTIEEFWATLKQEPSFGPERTANLQYTLQLGSLAGGYVPMVAELQAKSASGEISSLPDLVGLPRQDWLALVTKTGTPPNTAGETPAEQIRNYATSLQQTLEQAFPTQTITAGLRATQPESDLITFFDNSPNFAFTSNIDRYLQDNTDTAFTGISDVTAVTKQIKQMQRLYRLTPDLGRLEAITALCTAGLNSAQSIVHMGKEQFTKALGTVLGGTSIAESIYAKADQTTALALTIFGQYSTVLNSLTPAVIHTTTTTNTTTPTEDIPPTWQKLFGSLSFCACEECRSVYSPAAYLVDLLEFLKQQPATDPDGTVRNNKTALDVLFENRGDIGDIELSCDNTNTEMPYIDLVNEVLENAVARQQLVAQQTTWTAEELRANAEYLNELAYRRLAIQVYPRLLPFSLWLAESRTYLGHLGVSFDALMDVLQRRGLAGVNQPALELAIAFERLGLSPQVTQIVIGIVSPSYQPWDYWGGTQTDWPTALFDVPTFLRQAEISYAALVELLFTNYINPLRGNIILDPLPNLPSVPIQVGISISFSDRCNLEGATLNRLNETALDKIHRFLRLQAALGWTTLELDQAITTLAAENLTADFLRQLSQIRHLSDQLTIPIVELLSWWSAISTAVSSDDSGEISFYESLFLNNMILSPVDEAFALNQNRSDLENAGTATIGDHKAAILAALTVTEADFSLVLEADGLSDTDGLTLALLSQLFRNVSLARSLDLSIPDFLSIRQLTGRDPFANPQAAIAFTAQAEAIDVSDFSVAELDYLLRHVYAKTSSIAPIESSITLLLDSIRTALQTITAENAFVPDPTGSFTANRLSLLLTAEEVQIAMQLLAGDSLLSEAEQEAFIDEHFAPFLNVAEAKPLLVGATALAQPQARYGYVLRALLLYLRKTLSTQQVVQTLADDLGLEVAIAEALLTQYMVIPGNPGRSAVELFLAIAPDTEYSEAVLNLYRLLHKIALVLTKFDTTADELTWLFDKGPRLGWLDLTELPLTELTDAAAIAQSFQGWQRLVAIYQMHDAHASGDASLFDVLELAHIPDTREAVLAELSTVTGWNADDLLFLTGADGFDLTYPLHYRDERYLVRLSEAVALLKRLGLSAATVANWRISADLNEMSAIARDIKSTVKAKYNNATWLTVAVPLKDTLREQQRSALVAHLIATRPQIADSSDLYERYLIDVEMNACMSTSRIKQAISSVQLFVQRCLMNLGPDAEISEASAKQWQWMKNYRVWEANRKIFLYPENWILPELRDDKSPFFKDLENELLQNEMTEATAENALIGYLGKLDEVANLDVRSLYHQKEEGDLPIDILHVVARTHAVPHVYYYRQLVDGAYWTAWEQVNVDIQGDHLLAVVWNRRLYLMWPLFKELDATEVCKPLVDMVAETFPDIVDTEFWNKGGAESGTVFLESYFEAEFEDLLNAGDFPESNLIEMMLEWLNLLLKNTSTQLSFTEVEALVDDWFWCRSSSNDQKNWEIQLAWSEYKEGAWTAKKVTEETLTVAPIPIRSEEAIFFKPVITTGGLIRNETTIPDITTREFSSSSSLARSIGELIISCHTTRPQTVLSHGSFRFTGCNGRVVVTTYEDPIISPTHLFDASISLTNMQFIEDEGIDLPLMLPSSTTNSAGNWTGSLDIDNLTALNKTPGQFTLAVPAQYNEYVSQDDLFYQDETRCFHVVPRDQFDRYNGLQDSDLISFEVTARSTQPNLTEVEDNRAALRYPIANGSRRAVRKKLGRARTSAPASFDTTAGQPAIIQDLLDQSGIIISGTIPNGSIFGTTTLQFPTEKVFDFNAFSHPHSCTFFKELNRSGVDGLMRRSVQALSTEFFISTYDPDLTTVSSYPLKDVDFAATGAYSSYNWELFFHAPLMIAARLSQNQRFEEAQRWFHYIFNPTLQTDKSVVTGPERYWVFYPFYLDNTPQDINELLLQLNAGDPALEAQVAQWREHPFNPHLIARLRPEAYQKTVVMKYLDNLIAWGDSLFSRDTIEAINEATQLYILAGNLLGARPESLPATAVEDNQTYNTLSAQLDAFSNALVEIEDQFPVTLTYSSQTSNVPLPTLAFYFCIPNNDQLLGYWDTVADRLFKIRNCMNIEGVVRQLALFEPPIDPALLVAATAAGIDLSSVLNDLYAPLPPYRFQFILQKAVEFCGDVRSLGSSLLSALANQDAEELALLRASHEKQVVESIQQIREKQVEEANQTLESLQEGRGISEIRQTHYQQLLSSGLNPQENLNLVHLSMAQKLQSLAHEYEIRAAKSFKIPDVSISTGSVGTSFGGSFLGNIDRANAISFQFFASIESYQANLASITGGYDRRKQEWEHQVDLATKELEQIDKQIAAAAIRVAIAEQELNNHNQQIEHAQEVYDFMSGKYTNQDLYSWMVTQISSIYFTSYQMAYDLAKRAEKAYQHELGVTTSFITFGYWDSLKKGLHSGELLNHDLRRMEMSHLNQNKRELEITKPISLLQLDPSALLTLRETGSCDIHIPEVLFDMDFAGHYFRRIKAVRVTIPCITGPYTNISATLRLTKSWTRRAVPTDPVPAPEPDATLLPVSAIATSTGSADTGMFELNFRDERYLPFEGAGAISSWHLELPQAIRSFDYNTISDVVIHLSYSARDGGESFKQAVNLQLMTALNDWKKLLIDDITLSRLFGLRQEFSADWNRFFSNAGQPQSLTLHLSKQHFPRHLDYFWEDTNSDGKPDNQKPITLHITSVKAYLDPNGELPSIGGIQLNNNSAETSGIDSETGLTVFDFAFTGEITNDSAIDLTLTVSDVELRGEDWKNIYFLLKYEVKDI